MADAAAVPALRQFPRRRSLPWRNSRRYPYQLLTPKEVGVVARRAGSSRSIRLATNTAAINRAIVKNDRQRDDHDSRDTHTAKATPVCPRRIQVKTCG